MNSIIHTRHLFPLLDKKLIDLLRGLSAEEWNKRTLAKQWTVKDIASHLLDGNLKVISQMRDGYFGDPPGQINSYQDLVDYLNKLNADWVKASKRLSPVVLTELLEITGKEYYEQLSKLDLFKPALYAVSWAGQTESPNWFHIAREYTEKWHHQQQIREAVERPGIMTREFFYPLMDTFMQALPYTYKSIKATDGTTIRVTVTSEIGGSWQIVCHANTWRFVPVGAEPDTHIVLHPDTAWKLFTNGLTTADAEKSIQFTGNVSLGRPILSMLTVMA